MKLTDLAPETLAKIKTVRWDRIIEKHEGPDSWESVLQYYSPDFLTIEDCSVLLPVDSNQHDNITVLRTLFSSDGCSLTLFLQDTTYSNTWHESGFMAVCDKIAGEEFFLATLYHEWFIIEPNPVFG
ncbi:MAG: hypothetical protein WA902_10780 [Thermosynechococcaceae cyanobacterium]